MGTLNVCTWSCGRSIVQVRLDTLTECSLTAHPAANGNPVATLGGIKAARKELATLLHMLMAHDKRALSLSLSLSLSDKHSPTYESILN